MTIAANAHLHSFAAGLLERLEREFVRVGRRNTTITPGPNGTLTVSDHDGKWSGAAQIVHNALDKCPDDRGAGPDFWDRLPQ